MQEWDMELIESLFGIDYGGKQEGTRRLLLRFTKLDIFIIYNSF
jgi:hypothetical protein